MIWQLSSRTFEVPTHHAFWRVVANFVHYPLFGGLAVCLAESLRQGSPALLRGVGLVVTAYGIVDELHQGTVPGRTMAPGDVAMDALGAVGFLVLWWGLRGPGERRGALRSFGVVTVLAAGTVVLRETL